ncbi:unnamed protein product [Periconia digitata]|uniref:Uncharacterized protein n=1 Tax=Periconia digitata TaxID=1303443 RepID=A0A9W4ULK6_9PLEO|nr:unnamed protein product [Periconia digitata]
MCRFLRYLKLRVFRVPPSEHLSLIKGLNFVQNTYKTNRACHQRLVNASYCYKEHEWYSIRFAVQPSPCTPLNPQPRTYRPKPRPMNPQHLNSAI